VATYVRVQERSGRSLPRGTATSSLDDCHVVEEQTVVSREKVILGDAAHTAHFSKGYGTDLAIRDSLCLAQHLATYADVSTALSGFERQRKREVSAVQAQAASSHNWYQEILERYDRGFSTPLTDSACKPATT
jgi:2-polyprenyl-6-methoxyphenol hydroxylase-like FAD-dependent oxidoreductase